MRIRTFAVCVLATLLLTGIGRAVADDTPWQDAPPAHGTSPAAPPDDAPPAADAPAADAPPAAAPDADPGKDADVKCLVTGLPWKASSTRVEAIFKVDGMKQRGRFVGLPFMLIEYKLLKSQHHDVDILQVSVLEYTTFGTGNEHMILINDDWNNVAFITSNKKLPGSKGPYFAAFGSADDLDKEKKELGGKVMTYKAVLQQLFKALDSEDAPTATKRK